MLILLSRLKNKNKIVEPGNFNIIRLLLYLNSGIETNAIFDNVIINMTEGSSIVIDAIPWILGDLSGIPNVVNSNIIHNKVSFINGTKIQGCDKMWQGIRFSTQENVEGPTVLFDDVEIRDAYKAITTSDRGNFNLFEVDFIDNYIGLDADDYNKQEVKNCTFIGENMLKPSYLGITLDSDVAKYGISLDKSGRITFLNSTEKSTFTNLKCGIKSQGSKPSSTLAVANQVFIDNDTCVYAQNPSNVSVVGNEMSYNSIGIVIENPKANSQINTKTNVLTCNTSSNVCHSGIYLKNIQNAERVIVQSNVINGPNVRGINLDNIHASFYFIAENTVNNSLLGIYTRKNSGSSLNRIRLNNINSTTSTPLINGIGSYNLVGTRIELNTITDLNVSGFSSTGIGLNGNSHDNFLSENTVQSQNSWIGISLDQSMMNNLCCNSSSGALTDMRIMGTNSSTELRNSMLNSGKFQLLQTSIGTQEHAGNRWEDGAQGELINTNMDMAVNNNLFRINDTESNPTDGRIKPASITPTQIQGLWFRNEPTGNSKLCADPSNLDCGIEFGPPIIFPPDLGDYSPGPCEPLSLDIDNDGVCDDVDPDPFDACNPNFVDQDNDGVCDGIDHDPTDSNYPYSSDSDGDGTSDVIDSDILNPCMPNGIDQDNDGVCESFDPDDLDPLVPSIPNIVHSIVKDINNNYFATSSIKIGKPSRTLHQIENLADLVYGSHEYELVNNWENEYTLLNFLLHNQYYLSISDKLNNYWVNKTTNSRIWEFVLMANDVANYAEMNSAELHNLILKNAYLTRINSMMDYYSINYDSVFLETLIEKKKILNSEIKVIVSNSEQVKQNQRDQLRIDISNLSAPEVFHASQKEVWLKELNHDEGILSSSDISDLTSIAYLCPLEYGTAVYGAQSLLLQYESLDLYNLNDLCQNTGNKLLSIDNKRDINEIKIYPNPTSDVFRIEAQNLIIKLALFQNGKLLKVIYPNELNADIDLSKYANGVFQLKITTDNNTIVKQVLKIE